MAHLFATPSKWLTQNFYLSLWLKKGRRIFSFPLLMLFVICHCTLNTKIFLLHFNSQLNSLILVFIVGSGRGSLRYEKFFRAMCHFTPSLASKRIYFRFLRMSFESSLDEANKSPDRVNVSLILHDYSFWRSFPTLEDEKSYPRSATAKRASNRGNKDSMTI